MTEAVNGPEVSNPNEVAFFIGQLGSEERVQIELSYQTAADGSIGINLGDINKRLSDSPGSDILWVRPAGPELEDQTIIQYGEFEVIVDHIEKLLKIGGRDLELTNSEFLIVQDLARHPDEPRSGAILLDAIHGEHAYRSLKTVNVHISNIRYKMGKEYRRLIQTRKGVGFLLLSHLKPDPSPKRYKRA